MDTTLSLTIVLCTFACQDSTLFSVALVLSATVIEKDETGRIDWQDSIHFLVAQVHSATVDAVLPLNTANVILQHMSIGVDL